MAIEIDLDKLNIKTEVNGGRGPQPDPAENRQLAVDYAGMPENGLTMADLVGRYKSSPKNLYERLERMGVPRHKKAKAQPKKFKNIKKSKPFYAGVESEVKS